MLKGKAPELGLCDLDVLIEVAKLNRRQKLRTDGLSQRAKILGGHCSYTACIFWRTGIADHCASWRIEAGVIGYVAKVTLVADAVAAADAVPAVAEDVISKADPRRKGSPAGLPETMCCTLVCNLDLSAPDLRFKAVTRPEVEIGVQTWLIVVLHAVVLVAQTRVQSQLRRRLVAVFCIPGPILVAIAAGKGRLDNGRLDCTGGIVDNIAKVAVSDRSVSRARKLALGVDARLEHG